MQTHQAHAKINLALAVGPPQGPPQGPRGYHPIASIFVCVSLAGEVHIEPAAHSKGTFRTTWADDAPLPTPIEWPIEQDLGYRAWRALEAHTGRALPVHIDVRKRVPVGGGLGGGSSEAAAVLRGVNNRCALALSNTQLATIGATLGADVPFFLDDHTPARPAVVAGFGERITRVQLPTARVVLFMLPLRCPTGAVYKAFDAAMHQPPGTASLRGERIDALLNAVRERKAIDPTMLFNDLAAPAMHAYPALAEHARHIARASGATIHVTGSGSTLLALARDAVQEQRLIAAADTGVRALGVDMLVA